MTTSPTHICPKCRVPYTFASFLNGRGKAAKWCQFCRADYRDRLTSLHAKDKTKPKRAEDLDTNAIATQEGYKDHPLAQLLALSHIAGAKRALAIRDGKSWRGKKAWRAYYEAKAKLGEMLVLKPPALSLDLPTGYTWRVYGGDPDHPVFSPELTKLINDQCDPNQKPVS